MEKTPQENYLDLMKIVRKRFDTIATLKSSGIDNYDVAEIFAFHGRKIIEATAFGCLVATKNGFKHIPKDAQGQYNAETIFKSLSRKGINVLQSPSEIANATEEEQHRHNVKVTIAGIAERRITNEELIKIYQRMHNWLHELNPYTKDEQEVFYSKHQSQLKDDLDRLQLFLKAHFISIKGEGFFCTLWDKVDGQTKVISLSKISDI
jgi:hypothetical protein